MKTIKILGNGCANCNRATAIIEKTILETGINVNIEKVEELPEIMKYNIMSTPALVIDEEVKMVRRVPSKKEILKLLED